MEKELRSADLAAGTGGGTGAARRLESLPGGKSVVRGPARPPRPDTPPRREPAKEPVKEPAKEPVERFLGLVPLDWRFDLARIPLVRAILRSRWSTFIGTAVNLLVFMVILLAGIIGTPLGNANFGIMIVWILWWSALMLIMLPFATRIWCGVCPLPVFGEWMQRLAIINTGADSKVGLGRKWPRRWRNMWAVNFIFLSVAIFSGIITTRPWATALMLGVIILVSVVFHYIYEKRTFCRYLCPVGGFLGLYSNFSAMEVRRSDFAVCQGHKDKECFTGSDGGYGCPWLEIPMNMERNTYCGMCLECFRSCSLDNMSLNLRPFGTDLLVDRKRGLDESWKGFIMLGVAGFYVATMMGPWGWLKDWANIKTWPGFGLFALLFAFTVLAAVPAVHWLFAAVSHLLAGPGSPGLKKVFLDYSYPLMPLGLASWMAFSLAILLPNGSYVIPVISDPFGFGWDLFGTASFPWTPFLTGLLPYLQIPVMIFGLLYSIDIMWKLSRRTFKDRDAARWGAVPQVAYLCLLTAGFFWLFLG